MEDKIISLSINKEELLMVMRQTIGAIAEVSTLPEEQRAAMTDFVNGGKRELMETYINQAWNEMLRSVEAYARRASECNRYISNAYKEKDSFRVDLCLPTTFNEINLGGVMDAAQEFLMSTALSRYLLLTNKEEAQVFAGRADGARTQLKILLGSRVTPTRVLPFPRW